MGDKESRYHEWTPCEFYGHAYEVDEENEGRHVCKDCGDSYEDTPEA